VAAFYDADAVLLEGASKEALARCTRKKTAALISFSPSRNCKRWYEKVLIPFVYLRLAQKDFLSNV